LTRIDKETHFAPKTGWMPAPHSPVRILVVIALSIYIAEIIVMLILTQLPEFPILTEAIVDSTLLIVLVSPALFFFLLLPIIRHVKKREQAEAGLRKNRDLLQNIFNGISEPLLMLDDELKVKMINTAAIRYYSMADREILDQPCHVTLMGNDQPCEECDIPEKMSDNGNLTFERKGLFDSNRIEQVVMYRSASTANRPGATIVRITDVTEARILEQQVRQRERMASLGLLISGVSHEINNPNNFISFNLPILKEYLEEITPILDAYAAEQPDLEISNMSYDEFRADLFKILENIVHGSRRIDTIVSKLKAFSRIQDSRKLRRVSINAVLEKVVELADSQIKRMVRKFEMDVPLDLQMVYTDGQAIEQMVLNLLINACQAANKANSWVGLEARINPDPPYALCIEVIDNGCGIDKETLNHIFDPLFTTKGPHEGTGLGLYICHNLAEGLGGRIEVQSELGQGSTFRLMLPDLKENPLNAKMAN